MLGNICCWAMAIGLILSKTNNISDFYIRLLFAMGFILLGILSKAVDAYREVHLTALEDNTTENKNT